MPYREDIPGYMPRRDLEVLEAIAACVEPNGTAVEVGSYFGKSSWALAKSVDPSVTLYCIDPWPGSPSQQLVLGLFDAGLEDFKEYVKDCPNIVPIQGYSPHMPWPKEKKADLVFIDGSHISPDVDNDIAFWLGQLKETGILCGHDFNPQAHPDVCEAVIKTSKTLGMPIKIFTGSTIWYFKFGQEEFSEKNHRRQVNLLLLETMSWQPTSEQIKKLRKIYR